MMRTILTRNHIIYLVFCLLFIGLFVTIETINQKLWTNDLRVYFEAVRDFFYGNNPYVKSYGLDTGYFKYPPFTLYLFGYFAWIPFGVAQFIHLTISLLSLMISLPLLVDTVKKYILSYDRKYTWLIYLGFVSIMVHLAREFHMGNVNLILLALFAIGLSLLDKQSIWTTVISWSLMIILKPIMILTVIPLLFFKKWKHFFGIAACGVFFFIVPFLHKGFSGGLQLWYDWYLAIAEHGEYIASYNSFKYIVTFYTGWNTIWGGSLIGLFFLVTLLIFHRKKASQGNFLIDWCVVFAAFIPNFFVTDTEHFLLSVPLVILTVARIFASKRLLFFIPFVLAFIPLSLNSNDFLGRTLSTQVDIHGGTGIGNASLIILYVIVLFTQQTKSSSAHIKSEP